MVTILILSVLLISVVASTSLAPVYAPSHPVTSAVEVIFDTNFPNTNSPLDYGTDSPAGTYALVLKVDGQPTSFFDVSRPEQIYFMGPIKFTWDAETIHTYEWVAVVTWEYCTSNCDKKFVWESSTGLASERSGTITATSSGSITAKYRTELGQQPSAGPSPALPAPSDCGGLSFSLATPLPLGKCHHDGGDRYFQFTLDSKLYYAVVKYVSTQSIYSHYTISLPGINVILQSSSANYDLYVYDSQRNLVGKSVQGFNIADVVEILPSQPSPTPTPSTISTAFDGTYQVTFSYTANVGGYQAQDKMVLIFKVENGIVGHPNNIFSGTVDSNGFVYVTYSECIEITGVDKPGIVTGKLRTDGTGEGTFTCGEEYMEGTWVAAGTNTKSVPKPPIAGQVVQEYKLYQNNEDGFSIQYPASWQIDKNLPQQYGVTQIVKFSPDLEEDDNSIKVGIAANIKPSEEQVQSFLDKMLELMGKDCSTNPHFDEGEAYYCEDFSFLEKGSTSLGTIKSSYFDASHIEIWDNEKYAYHDTVIIFSDKNNVWVISIKLLQEEAELHSPTIKTMIESFNLFDFQSVPAQEPTPTPSITPSPPKTTKYLLYENKQYSFSIKYPSTWEKTESFEKDSKYPNRINLIQFAPSQLTFYAVSLVEDDTKYKGLRDANFLDKMDQEAKVLCSSGSEPGITCVNVEAGEPAILNHLNGYKMYFNSYGFTFSTDQGTVEWDLAIGLIPDGNDIWEIGAGSFSTDEFQQYFVDFTSIGSSFTIFDYEGEQESKLFKIQSINEQVNNLVYIVILNQEDSQEDIYGIKFTSENGKIKNSIKLEGWDYKQVGPNEIMYQTKSLPIKADDLLGVILKVDNNDAKISYEFFSNDMKSLGSGE